MGQENFRAVMQTAHVSCDASKDLQRESAAAEPGMTGQEARTSQGWLFGATRPYIQRMPSQ